MPYYDEDGALRTVTGQQPDGSYTTVDYGGEALDVPSAPIVEVRPGALTITWDGYDEGDEAGWPVSFAGVVVHLTTDPGTPVDDDTEIHVFPSAAGGSVTFALPENTLFAVTFQSRSTSGVLSAPSATVQATVGPFPANAALQAQVDKALEDAAAALELIDGGVFPVYTSPSPNVGIKLNDAGLIAYDSRPSSATAGQPTFILSAESGDVILRGQILAGSSITGSDFKTATTGRRVEISPTDTALPASVRFYPSFTDVSPTFPAGVAVLESGSGTTRSYGARMQSGVFTAGGGVPAVMQVRADQQGSVYETTAYVAASTVSIATNRWDVNVRGIPMPVPAKAASGRSVTVSGTGGLATLTHNADIVGDYQALVWSSGNANARMFETVSKTKDTVTVRITNLNVNPPAPLGNNATATCDYVLFA